MTRNAAWRAFFLSTPCDCNPLQAASKRCNLSGWIRCNRRLEAWWAHPDNPERKQEQV